MSQSKNMVIMIILTLFLLNRLNFGNQWIILFKRVKSDAAYVSSVVALIQYCHPFSDVSGNTYLLFVKGNIG